MAPPSVMFVAGDVSGDQHAAPIIARLRATHPPVACFGIGGSAMRSQGFAPLMPFEAFNKMGLWEVLLHLPFFLAAKKRLIDAMDEAKPLALVCVDYPGLNIPLMKAAHARKIPVVWYIVPQVWAWKKKRAELLGKYASFIGTVFPFETDFFKGYNARVSFVGHPLVEALRQRQAAAAPGESNTGPGPARSLSLIPGSRRQEVIAMLPVMIDAAMLLRKRYPSLRVSVSRCAGLPPELYQQSCERADVELFEGPLCDLLGRSDFAFVTSGTATLETALAGVPMVIAYRTSAMTYWLLKRMIRVPYIGLPNIVADEKIVPECIQAHANGKELAAAMIPCIDSPELRRATVEKLSLLKGVLGGAMPSMEISRAIGEIISAPKPR
jgi:lipid-A-disaccharide synthase